MISPVQTETPGSDFPNTKAHGQVGRAVLIAAMLWLVSSQAYYALVEALELDSGYDGAPVLFTAYYIAWAAVAFWLFRSLIPDTLDRSTIGREGLVMLPILAGFALFVVYGLPLLPEVSALRAPSEAPEFMFASAWYYLPKSADILFQQVLAAGLILAAARAGYGLVPIAVGMAVAFGGFHLLLAFDGFTLTYVTRFTLTATALGAVLPYLYLRVRSGFRWAYGLHWGLYPAEPVQAAADPEGSQIHRLFRNWRDLSASGPDCAAAVS